MTAVTSDVLVDRDVIAEHLLSYARARGRHHGARSWADRVERSHADYYPAQRRAYEAADNTRTQLHTLSHALFASPHDRLAHEAFVEAFERANREAYGEGFDNRSAPNPTGFDDEPEEP